MPKAEKLTPKQKKFCDEYLKCGNATQAAIKAGYSPKTAKAIGAENLTKPYIKSYIEKRNAQVDKKQIADLEDILRFLTSIIEDEDANKSDRLKAADMRLKTLGAYLDRVQTTGETTIHISVDGGDADA